MYFTAIHHRLNKFYVKYCSNISLVTFMDGRTFITIIQIIFVQINTMWRNAAMFHLRLFGRSNFYYNDNSNMYYFATEIMFKCNGTIELCELRWHIIWLYGNYHVMGCTKTAMSINIHDLIGCILDVCIKFVRVHTLCLNICYHITRIATRLYTCHLSCAD